jgi:hypothetical protein
MDSEEENTWAEPGGQPEWLRWFDELADLPAGERVARLAGLAKEKPELAERLLRLFAAEEGAPEILSRPVAERAPGFVAEAFVAEAGRGRRSPVRPARGHASALTGSSPCWAGAAWARCSSPSGRTVPSSSGWP